MPRVEQFEPHPKKEEALRERITSIEQIPWGVHGKAETVLVLLGEKPAAELGPMTHDAATEVAQILANASLLAEVVEKTTPKGKPHIVVDVATSEETLESLKQSNSWNDPIRYGTLMGYPTSAVNAFAEGNEDALLPEEERRTSCRAFLRTIGSPKNTPMKRWSI